MRKEGSGYVGLVPYPGRVYVYFRVGITRDVSWDIIKNLGVEPEITNPRGLGTAWRVVVPTGKELEFMAKFRSIIEVNDATVEWIKK